MSDDEVDVFVAYTRSWEATPPAVSSPEMPAPVPTEPVQPVLTANQVFVGICAQCHGLNGEGGSGPAINPQDFQAKYADQTLFDLISNGIPSTPMIGVGELLSDEQINQLVSLIRNLKPGTNGVSTFSGQVLPILQAKCQACHNSSTKLGGWDASSYESVITSRNNSPVIIAGDVQNSLLAQYLLGSNGKLMPPLGGMSQDDIQVILDWIAAGAEND